MYEIESNRAGGCGEHAGNLHRIYDNAEFIIAGEGGNEKYNLLGV